MRTLSTIFCLIWFTVTGFSQFVTKYPEIPRIDVHTHVSNNYPGISNYLAMRDSLAMKHNIDVAMWINLCSREGGETGIDTITVLTPQIAGHNLKNKLGLIKFGNNDRTTTKIYT